MSLKYVKKTSMPDSVKSLWNIKYYSLSSTRGLEHSTNSICNNCQKIGSINRSEARISENIIFEKRIFWKKNFCKSVFSNATYDLNILLTNKESKNDFLKKI